MTNRRKVIGETIDGMYLWEAEELSDTEWISTGKPFNVLVRHTSLQSLVTFWLAQVPDTYEVFTSWGTTSYPNKVIVNSIANMVADELKG